MNENIWYDVDEFLPGHSEWVIVHCLDKKDKRMRYLEAYYTYNDGWGFLEDNENHEKVEKDYSVSYESRMKVLNWMNLPNLFKIVRKLDIII